MFLGIDLAIFHALYALEGHGAAFDWVIIFVAQYLPMLMGLFVIWLVCTSFRAGKREDALAYIRSIVIGVIGRYGVAELIRFFLHRPRPFLALQLPHLLTENSYSFPSGHTIFLIGMAIGVFFVNKRYGYWLFALSVIVGLARVVAGVHYPSDILGGAVLGVATAHGVRAIWRIRPIDKKH